LTHVLIVGSGGGADGGERGGGKSVFVSRLSANFF